MPLIRNAGPLLACTLLAGLLSSQAAHAQAPAAQTPVIPFTSSDPLFTAARSLQHWWPGDGHVLDLVGQRHAAMRNKATFAPGRLGKAFSFDGLKSVVDLGKPDAPGTPTPAKAFTIMLWFCPQTQASWQYLVFCWGDSGMDININEFQPGRIAGQLGEGPGYSDTFGKTWTNAAANFHPVDQWHHLAFTFDGARACLYRDGQLASQTPWTRYTPSSSPLLLGAQDRNTGNNSYKGLIEDVALFDRGLSSDQIAAIYQAQTTPLPLTLADADLQKCDAGLRADPAPLAWYAAQRLASDPVAARKHFTPQARPEPDPQVVAQLIKNLNADGFNEREHASAALLEYGTSIAPILRAALDANPDPEIAGRIQQILSSPQAGEFMPGQVRAARVAAVLARLPKSAPAATVPTHP